MSSNTTVHSRLRPDLQLRIHELMVKARVLEERLITMNRKGEGYFWIGGPGEEAFSVPLGLQVKKGEGLDYDYLHLHYRSSGILLAMGAEMIDSIRQMGMRATDPYSAGRNFANHYAVKKWNVVPMAPTIETQFSIAPGTALAQKRHGGTGITIVNGGDAGTAEGDFATCLVWSTRPGMELPVLMIVMNNGFGISTLHSTQHGVRHIADRAVPHGIVTDVVDGNDPVASWLAIEKGMDYVRRERRPYLIEAKVSRLHGHSSSSGANRVSEADCIAAFEDRLVNEGVSTKAELALVWEKFRSEAEAAAAQVRQEPFPEPGDEWKWTFRDDPGERVAKSGGEGF
ncbi:MAG TPA: thiamine pyrophosphate-dependent dehydrogenase E1 component subunit alpha [Planctomycetota bacterium]|nr:thiamine pyrophosphate-dependent dehydrogenase E1 component subunit alpha [Planctomycetota bacterium]